MSDDELNLTKQLDESTNIYNNEMIVGVDGEIT
jgi:hypothetical protein